MELCLNTGGMNVGTIEVLTKLSLVGEIYPGLLVDRVPRMTGVLIDDEQGGFRVGSGCVDQI